MFNNTKEIFSFRKYKDGRTDSAKIGLAVFGVVSALALGNTGNAVANEPQPITQGTGVRNVNTQDIQIQVSADKTTLATSEQTTVTTKVNVGGKDVTINGSYLEFELQSTSADDRLVISDFNGKKATQVSRTNDKDGSETAIYRIDLGNIVSGATISIPSIYHTETSVKFLGDNTHKIIARLKDNTGQILKESYQDIKYSNNVVPTIKTAEIVHSTFGYKEEGTKKTPIIAESPDGKAIKSGAILELYVYTDQKNTSYNNEIKWDPALYELVPSENVRSISNNRAATTGLAGFYKLRYIGKTPISNVTGIEYRPFLYGYTNTKELPYSQLSSEVAIVSQKPESKFDVEASFNIGENPVSTGATGNKNRQNLETDEMSVRTYGYNDKKSLSTTITIEAIKHEDSSINSSEEISTMSIKVPYQLDDNTPFEGNFYDASLMLAIKKDDAIVKVVKKDGQEVVLNKLDSSNGEIRYRSPQTIKSAEISEVVVDFNGSIPVFKSPNKFAISFTREPKAADPSIMVADKYNGGLISKNQVKPNTYVSEFKVNGVTFYGGYGAIQKPEEILGFNRDVFTSNRVVIGTDVLVPSGGRSNYGEFTLLEGENKLVFKVPNGIVLEPKNEDVQITSVIKEGDFTIYEAVGQSSRIGNTAVNSLFKLTVTPAVASLANGANFIEKEFVFGAVGNTPSVYTVRTPDPKDIDKDNNLDEQANPGRQAATSASATIRIDVPKSLYMFDNSKSIVASKLADTRDVRQGETVTIYPKAINTTDNAYKDMKVVTVLPKLNDKHFDGAKARGSQFTPKLAGPVTAPTGWTVEYTTQDQAGDGSKLTEWTKTVSDYSKVTALRWVSSPGTILASNKEAEFSYDLKIPDDVLAGSKITTTSAIAVDGLNTFMEGYRSTVEVKRTYGSVVVKYEDETGKQIKNPVTVHPNTTLTGTKYTLTANHKPSTFREGSEEYSFVKVKEGSAQETGAVKEGETVITLTYTAAKEETRTTNGTVKVKFVDTEGNTLKPEIVDTNNSIVETIKEKVYASGKRELISSTPSNATYDANEHKTNTLTNGNTTYHFLAAKDNNISGKLTAGETVVTLVYGKETSRTTNGTVKVKYIDTAGTTIKPDEIVENNVVIETIKEKTLQNGTKEVISVTPSNKMFNLNSKKLPIIESNGEKYHLVETRGDVTGEVNVGERVTTFVYRKEVTAKTPTTGIPFPTYDLTSLPFKDIFEPTSDIFKITKGGTITEEDLIGKVKGVPTGNETLVKVINKPSTDTPGEYEATIEITYPDGTKDVVKIPVLVKDTPPTRELEDLPIADLFNPKGGTHIVDKDKPYTDEDIFKTLTGIPENRDNVTIKIIGNKPKTNIPGTYPVTVEITYPDGTKDTTTVNIVVVEKNNTPKEGIPFPTYDLPTIPMNELFTPTGGLVDVHKGGIITDEDLTKIISNTPTNGETIKVIDKPSTDKPGEYEATIEITYPDGTKDVVKIPVLVKDTPPTITLENLPVTDLFNPKGGTHIVDKDKPYTDEDVFKTLTGIPENLGGTTITIIGDKPKTNIPGTYPVTVEITYPDGTKDTTTVNIVVVEKNNTPKEGVPFPTYDLPEIPMNELFNPTGNLIEIPKGGLISDTDLIELINNGPKPGQGNEVRVINKPSTDKPGEYESTIEITYPDGTKDTVKIPILVLDTPPTVELENLPITDLFNPTGGIHIVEKGTPYTEEDLIRTIVGGPRIENGTTVKIIGEKPSTDTPGKYDVEIEITYPDGSKDKVITTLKVIEKTAGGTAPTAEKSKLPIADLFNPIGETITVEREGVVTDEDITSKVKGVPETTGATYKVIERPSTANVGDYIAKVEITYPDGSKDIVEVPIKVVSAPTEPETQKPTPTTTESTPIVEDAPVEEKEEPAKKVETKELPKTNTETNSGLGFGFAAISAAILAFFRRNKKSE